MSILVTGRRGQLATALVEEGGRRGVAVIAAGRPELNLTDAASVARALREMSPELVINAAAYTAVDKAESEAAAARDVNALGAARIAEACAARGVPLIHISTDYVFDGRKGAPYVESDATAPTGIYGASKLEGERLVAAACRRHVILRTSWLYSPWGSNFLRTMLRLAETKAEIGVVDDQLGNPTYAPHLAGAILDVAARLRQEPPASVWGTYHLAGAGSTSWCGLAREIFRVSAALGGPSARVRPIATHAYKTAARRPADSRLDCSLARSVFGVALPPWREGVRDCLARLPLAAARGGAAVDRIVSPPPEAAP